MDLSLNHYDTKRGFHIDSRNQLQQGLDKPIRECGHQFENPFQHSYKRKKGFTPEKQKLLSHDREKEAKKSAKNTALGQLLGNAPILPTQPRIVD